MAHRRGENKESDMGNKSGSVFGRIPRTNNCEGSEFDVIEMLMPISLFQNIAFKSGSGPRTSLRCKNYKKNITYYTVWKKGEPILNFKIFRKRLIGDVLLVLLTCVIQFVVLRQFYDRIKNYIINEIIMQTFSEYL